jgi:hypothetical protein
MLFDSLIEAVDEFCRCNVAKRNAVATAKVVTPTFRLPKCRAAAIKKFAVRKGPLPHTIGQIQATNRLFSHVRFSECHRADQADSNLLSVYPSIAMDVAGYSCASSSYNSSSGFGAGAFWSSASTQTS